ncbi:MAG: hypothetical protein LBD27_06320 [Tannerella sp.]|nr:hypothetical protein [Tannerella sp.]
MRLYGGDGTGVVCRAHILRPYGVDAAGIVCRRRPASLRDASLGRKAFHNTPLHPVGDASLTGCRGTRGRMFYRA